MKKNRKGSWLRGAGMLLGSLAVCHAAGALGAIATRPAIPVWYAELAKPAFNPPNWIFGPVWGTLYTLMAVALYLVWRRGLRRNRGAIAVFAVQLALNATWSFVFFGMHEIGWSLAVILAMLVFILWSAAAFWRIRPWAGALLLPYICWVSFAAVLNFAIWRLN